MLRKTTTLALLLVSLFFGRSAAIAQTQSVEIKSPPPVSGRSLSDKELLQPSDVMARLILVHENLELVRLFMGRSKELEPLFMASEVTVADVYFSSLNLRRRLLQVGFEQLRIGNCLLYTSPSPRDATLSRMPSSA